MFVVFTIKKSNLFLLGFYVYSCDFRSSMLIQHVKMKKITKLTCEVVLEKMTPNEAS